MKVRKLKQHARAQAKIRRRNNRKKWYGTYRTDVHVGSIVETCSLHIGHVLEVNRVTGDMRVNSFFNGGKYDGGCDLYSCGIAVQSAKQIKQKLDLFNEGGMKAIHELWERRCRLGLP